jgi:hypothetical protein
MSFNTAFDYTAMIGEYTNYLSNYNTQMTSVNNAIAQLENSTGFPDEKAQQLEMLNGRKTMLQESIDQCNLILTNITNTQNLGTNDKATLYTFWTICQVNVMVYMKKILWNYVAMLVDTRITDLITNSTNNPQQKMNIGRSIMNDYIFREI